MKLRCGCRACARKLAHVEMSVTEGVRNHSATAEHALGSPPRVDKAVFLSRFSSSKCWLLTVKVNALFFPLGLGGLRSTVAAIEVEHDEALVSGHWFLQ